MITLLQLFPDHLDLNGDAGNLKVLQRRLEWAGIEVKTVSLQPGQDFDEHPDVVFVGHGSTAAWKQVYTSLARLAPKLSEWMEAGTIVFAISSGFAALHGLLPGLVTSIDRTERASKFISEDFGDQTLVGYLNSDLALPNLLVDSNLIGSMLHGPLLAKNSWLSDFIFEKLGISARVMNESKFTAVEKLELAARQLATEQSRD